MTEGDFPPETNPQRRMVELLEAILDELQDLNQKTESLTTTTETVSSTLTTFLKDWQTANPPSGPAAAVTVVWGRPQPLPPKGT